MPAFPIRSFTGAVGAALLILPGCASSPVSSQTDLGLEPLFQEWRSEEAPGFALGVMQSGEITYVTGAGLADLSHDIPIKGTTVFHAASITKQFTAYAVLSLVAEGRVGLDDDIRDHLPELSYAGPPITIQHLLDHMSGLREASTLAAVAGWRPDDVFTEGHRIGLLEKQTSLNFLPGTEVEYSNSGYALLAELVEVVTGKPFRDYLEAEVFDPLGMESSLVRTDLTEIIPGRAASYRPGQDGFVSAPLNYEIVGSTGLQTTVEDLLLWARSMNDQALAEPSVYELMAQRTEAESGMPSVFGRGQELRPYRGLQTWSHGGTDAGYKSFLLRIPEEDFAVAILSNREDFDTAKLAFAITDTLLFGGPAEPVPFEKVAAQELEALAGTYELYPGIILDITTDGEQLLFAFYGGGEGAPLAQTGTRQFLLNPARDLSLVFPDPAEGPVDHVEWTIGLHGALRAKRIELVPFDTTTVNLGDYAGTYESEALGISYEVEATEEGLLFRHHRLPPMGAVPYQEDTFRGFSQINRIVFVRNRRGLVTDALMSSPLANDIVFTRKR